MGSKNFKIKKLNYINLSFIIHSISKSMKKWRLFQVSSLIEFCIYPLELKILENKKKQNIDLFANRHINLF